VFWLERMSVPAPLLVRLPAPVPPLEITPEMVEVPESTWVVRVWAVLVFESATAPATVALARLRV
jgi:hypothetical protein